MFDHVRNSCFKTLSVIFSVYSAIDSYDNSNDLHLVDGQKQNIRYVTCLFKHRIYFMLVI